MKKSYVITNEIGLHARPASLLVRVASKYEDQVFILFKNNKLTLKSIMAVMSLGVPYGGEFTIEVIGNNEEVIFQELETVLLDNKLI